MAIRKFFIGSVRKAAGRRQTHRSVPLAEQHTLTLVGEWPESRVRRLHAEGRHVTLLGECFASDQNLVDALTDDASLPEAAEALARLAGSYSTVVTDGVTTAVTGDIAGLHRIWFRRGEREVQYASSPLPLAAMNGYRLDQEALAAHLFCAKFSPSLGGDSLFDSVRALAPDQILLVRNGTATVLRRMFPIEQTGFFAASTALRHALQESVHHRTTKAAAVSADFSGGLDSSTLALLAAQHHQEPIQVVTYADPFARNDDDIVHAARFAGMESSLRQTVVEGTTQTLPFTNMAVTPFTEEPSLDSVIYARDRARLLPVVGTSVHLTGDGGDVVLGAPLTYLADLARPRHLLRFLRESGAWARLRHRPVHRVVQAAVDTARTSYSATLTHLAHELESNDPPEWRRHPAVERNIVWASLSRAADWGTRAARTAVAERLRRAAETVTGIEGADAHTLRTIHRHTAASRSFIDIAEHLGVQIAMPFFDNQVVAACLSVPATQRASVDRVKPLLGAAMTGLLPPELFERRTKGDYSASEYHGIRRNAAALRSLLRDSRLGDLGIIDPSSVLRELEAAASGAYAAMASLGEVFAFEVWLRGLDHQPRVSFSPSTLLEVC